MSYIVAYHIIYHMEDLHYATIHFPLFKNFPSSLNIAHMPLVATICPHVKHCTFKCHAPIPLFQTTNDTLAYNMCHHANYVAIHTHLVIHDPCLGPGNHNSMHDYLCFVYVSKFYSNDRN